MKVVVNAASAKMGGAARYVLVLARQLAAWGDDDFVFLVPESQASRIRPISANIHVIPTEIGSAPFWKRLHFDQVTLRQILLREKADVLYSTANIGMTGCPCRQILLVRNSLQFSRAYERHILPIKSRRFRLENWLRRWLICRSARAADVVMTPSQSMLDELRSRCALPITKTVVNPYGVARNATQSGRSGQRDGATLLYTSLYGEHKNCRTLFLAILELIKSGTHCRLITSADPTWPEARYTSTWKADASLVKTTELREAIQFVMVDDGDAMDQLYNAADIFVYPSFVESFGHPLAEAMIAGLPIVAADCPVNRELCSDAALYFNPLDPSNFAAQVRRLLSDHDLRQQLGERALKRSDRLRWESHVKNLVALFRD